MIHPFGPYRELRTRVAFSHAVDALVIAFERIQGDPTATFGVLGPFVPLPADVCTHEPRTQIRDYTPGVAPRSWGKGIIRPMLERCCTCAAFRFSYCVEGREYRFVLGWLLPVLRAEHALRRAVLRAFKGRAVVASFLGGTQEFERHASVEDLFRKENL
ncbi:MAG: hypothetical protein E6R03_17010 [Hyphomicrobiaceae bacterium]|nr:MAG: hypothetical protein E6R03_17010 [Hyphomicrobiaceae bacterium]